METFKDFFAGKIVFDANHHYHENIQRLVRLQNCLSCKPSISWKYSKILACKIVLAANHHYPEKIQRRFRLQNWLSRKSSLSWKHSKTFSPAKLSSTQIIIILKLFKDFLPCKIVFDANHHYPENIQRLVRLQICLSCKPSISWKYSKNLACKIVLAANHHYPENIQSFFTCEIASAANHHYPEIIQRLFPLQNCLRRKSSLSWKNSKTCSPAKLS